MIRQLSELDHDECFALLKKRPAENLFIIGDIEAYGYTQDFQKVWGEFNEEGQLIAVLLKYEQNYIPFSKEETFNAAGFAEIMLQDPDFSMISGIKAITEKIEPYLQHRLKQKRQTYYAKCNTLLLNCENVNCSLVQQADIDDAEAIVSILKAVPEFKDSIVTVEKKHRELQDGVSRSFL